MVGEKVPATLRSFLLRILCDVGFCASHAPVQVSKNLHQSSFTPPATLLLHFPCGAWGKRKYLTHLYLHICVTRISYIMTQERSLYVLCTGQSTLYCPVGLATLPAGLYAETVVDALKKANGEKKSYIFMGVLK